MEYLISGFIESNDKFLVVKRESFDQFNGLWEFPCTKSLSGMSDQSSLDTALAIRLHMEAKAGDLIAAKDFGNEFKKLYSCSGSNLEFSTKGFSGYSEGRFISLDEMPNYNMHPADYVMAQEVAHRRVRKVENNLKIS